MRQRFVTAAERLMRETDIVVERGIVRILRDRLTDEFDRGPIAAGLLRNDAEKIERLGMVRIAREDRLAEIVRLRDRAATGNIRRQLQRARKYRNWSRFRRSLARLEQTRRVCVPGDARFCSSIDATRKNHRPTHSSGCHLRSRRMALAETESASRGSGSLLNMPASACIDSRKSDHRSRTFREVPIHSANE